MTAPSVKGGERAVAKRKPRLKLTGRDGNAFYILARAHEVADKNGMDWEPIRKEMTSGDYDHLLQTVMKHFDVT